MALSINIRLALIGSCVIYMIVLTVGCRNPRSQQQHFDDAPRSELCILRDRMTIGLDSPSNSLLLDACTKDINRSVAFVIQSVPAKAFDYDAPISPDGRDEISHTSAHLVITEKENNAFTISTQRYPMLAGPLWSPDSRFFFFVTKESLDVSQSSQHCLDDAFDIHVVSIRSRSESIVGRVCAGVPYSSLRWLSG
jgi:hypothetical protein